MLARQWREALAANTMGAAAARQAEDARQRAAEQEVRSAQSAWLRLGPLRPKTRKPLQERFDRACRKFFETETPARWRGRQELGVEVGARQLIERRRSSGDALL